MKQYLCACGQVTGVRCDWVGTADKMAVVEHMPAHLRASHEAAGNRGAYPHNGAERIACEASCAAMLVDGDEEWTSIIEADVTTYAEEVDAEEVENDE